MPFQAIAIQLKIVFLTLYFSLLQKQRKMLRDRLAAQFSDAIKNFQAAQRNAVQKERESVMRARAQSGLTGVRYIFIKFL